MSGRLETTEQIPRYSVFTRDIICIMSYCIFMTKVFSVAGIHMDIVL